MKFKTTIVIWTVDIKTIRSNRLIKIKSREVTATIDKLVRTVSMTDIIKAIKMTVVVNMTSNDELVDKMVAM